MSKNRVWNKGKHNGAGLSRKQPTSGDNTPAEGTVQPEMETSNPRIDTVKPMNRENWVVRPSRVIQKTKKTTD